MMVADKKLRVYAFNGIGPLTILTEMVNEHDQVTDRIGQLNIPDEFLPQVTLLALTRLTQQGKLTAEVIDWCYHVAKTVPEPEGA